MAKRRRKNLSAKQIRFFGSPAQKAALKRKRSKKRKVGAKRHRPRSAPRSNPAPRKRRRAAAKAPRRHKRRTAKRRNPTPAIISWTLGNPARRKGKKTMARRRKKRSSVRRSNAGRSTRRHTKRVMHRRRGSRRNPGMGSLGSPMDWLQGGAGTLAGVVGARALPQMLLGASNAGPMGYAANFVTAAGLGWLTHMLFPRNRVLTGAVIAGGFAGTFARIISDKTSFGSALSMTGLGDWGLGLYQKSNFNNPQRVQGPRGLPSSNFTWGVGDQALVPGLTNGGSDSSLPC